MGSAMKEPEFCPQECIGMMASVRLRLLPALALVALVAGCASVTTAPPQPADPLDAVAGQINELEAAGNYGAAAELYLGLRGTPAQEREWRLRAAETLLRGSDAERALMVAEPLDPYLLESPQKARLGLVRSRALLLLDDLDGAIAALPAGTGNLSPELLREVLDNRITLFSQVSRPVDELLDRLALDRLPTLSEAERRDNLEAVWRLLPRVPEAVLPTLLSVDRDMPGWIALFQVARIPVDQQVRFDQDLRAWERRFPGHPAQPQAERMASARLNRRVPPALALMVPASGRYAGPGLQVRAGFMAAHNRTLEPRPLLRTYDTEASPTSLALSRASAEGAGLVVGPLLKPNVEELARQADRRVPVLALNRVSSAVATGADFYQFGLAPEDEAAQIGRDALRAGARRALVLYPEDDWGNRVHKAFAQAFQAGGGMILDAATYDSGQADFSKVIKRLFLMDAAEQRRSRLQGIVGRRMEFDARRRDDADFVMLAAFPAPVRLIYPQLRFYRLGDLPVLSTSHVYAGAPDPINDQDLSGLRFVEMPFLVDLDEAGRQQWIDAVAGAPKPDRLFALGADAHALAPWLAALAASPGSELEGLTGRLRVDADNRLVRTLGWAEFRNGQVAPLPAGPWEGT